MDLIRPWLWELTMIFIPTFLIIRTNLFFCIILAGLLILISLVFYPAGWGAERVQDLCGPDAAPFQPGTCAIGWSFFVAVGSTVATFLSAVLSVQAEIATSSDDVQDEILKGKYIICLPWWSITGWVQRENQNLLQDDILKRKFITCHDLE